MQFNNCVLEYHYCSSLVSVQLSEQVNTYLDWQVTHPMMISCACMSECMYVHVYHVHVCLNCRPHTLWDSLA